MTYKHLGVEPGGLGGFWLGVVADWLFLWFRIGGVRALQLVAIDSRDMRVGLRSSGPLLLLLFLFFLAGRQGRDRLRTR